MGSQATSNLASTFSMVSAFPPSHPSAASSQHTPLPAATVFLRRWSSLARDCGIPRHAASGACVRWCVSRRVTAAGAGGRGGGAAAELPPVGTQAISGDEAAQGPGRSPQVGSQGWLPCVCASACVRACACVCERASACGMCRLRLRGEGAFRRSPVRHACGCRACALFACDRPSERARERESEGARERVSG